MFDLGWPEILVIAIVLIVVVGPKDLPRMLRTFGRTTSKLREMAGDFRKQFDDALKEAELDDVKDLTDQARKLDPRSELRKHFSPLEKAGKDIKSGLDQAMKPKPSDSNDPAASETHTAEPAKAGATNTPGPDASETGKEPATPGKAKTAGKTKAAAKAKASSKPAPTSKSATRAGSAKAPGTSKSTGAAKSTTSAKANPDSRKAAPKKSATNGATKPAKTKADSAQASATKASAKKAPAAGKSAAPRKSALRGKTSGPAS